MIWDWLALQSVHAVDALDPITAADPNLTASSGVSANALVGIFFNRIADLLLFLTVPLAIVAIFWAAVSLIQSAGNPEGYAKARKIILWILSGLFFIAAANILVRLAINAF